MTDSQFVLKYSHNIVEHLGLKLYQNRPTRVLAELVSNSWDADSKRIDIAVQMSEKERWAAVADNGHGMTRDAVASSYLLVGRPKRKNADDKSPGGRPLMGRKGIGKLAAFGIAKTVDVITRAKTDEGVSSVWLRFHLDQMLNKGEGLVSYEPDVLADGMVDMTELLEQDVTGAVGAWLKRLGSAGSGTLVVMTDLTLGRTIPVEALIGSIGERFTVAVGRGVEIYVNDRLATPKNLLPEFEYRIPETGLVVDTVGGREVRHWVGFVKNASWPQDAAGVGVYAHGKIAQDRPFTFYVKGKEIFTRYMMGYVEADWLDELPGDLISTDRTSVNWDAPEVTELREWGAGQVRRWIASFEDWRREEETAQNATLVKEAVAAGAAARLTEAEESEIVRLVSEVTPSFGKDEGAKKRLVSAVSDAWVQKPMRKLVKDLWSSLSKADGVPPDHFTEVIERLSSHSVPESLNLAVVFAQRAFALTRLHDYVHHGIETDLQNLIARFPWIIEPDLAVLTANSALKTAVAKAEALGQIPVGRRKQVAGVNDDMKPDFVFLSSPEERQIVVVELKGPQESLTITNRQQLVDYLNWFEEHYPEAELSGVLVGLHAHAIKAHDARIEIVEWTDVLRRSRARNVELLAAMILATGGSGAVDSRLADALELGGDDARKLLERLAAEHAELGELMAEFKAK